MRREAARVRVPVAAPTRPDQRWSMAVAREPTADGRPFRIWTPVGVLTRECPPLFAEALRAVKQTVDPEGIMNPGVLIDPAGRKVGVRGAMAGT